MSVEQEVKDLNYRRLKSWDAAKAILDRASAQGRDMTAEERQGYDRAEDEIRRFDRMREELLSSDRAHDELDTINAAYRSIGDTSYRSESQDATQMVLQDFLRPLRAPGRYNAIEIDLAAGKRAVEAVRSGMNEREVRSILTDGGSSGGSLTVPTMVDSAVYAYLTASVAMRRMNCTIVTTDGGNPILYPKVGTHSLATQVATQATAFAGTDPVLAAVTLNAFDFGELVAISNDMLEDSGVDIITFIGSELARAVGQLTATAYVTGSGSGQPNGIETAMTGSGTIATGGSLLALGTAGRELEKLIDLQYSVVDSYRQVKGGCSWLMRDLTGAKIRKIRDGAGGTTGQFVWQPSPTVGAIGGQPDRLLGDPVYFDPNVASAASGVKSIFYGNFSAYYIRDARGFRLERSDDLYFNLNQVAFRGLLRTDGDVVDTNAFNVLHQSDA